MDPRVLEVVTEIAKINGEWQIIGELMKRAIRGVSPATELQFLAEKIDELQHRMQEVMKKNDELLRA